MINKGAYSAIAGGIGCFFAPASATAAGGVLNVMGACAIGGAIAAPFAGILSGIVGIATLTSAGFTGNKYVIAAAFGALTAADLFMSSLLAAEIGAAILGIPAHPVFICSLVGSAAVGIPTFLIALAVIVGVSHIFSEEIDDTMLLSTPEETPVLSM
ncbi:MAG: hypothetical protein K0U24_00145 [Gammaproteobacteria bacterium]|nr:hypothetical protein [Gammaproteobacteria bacterium]MCH9762637.1 hypothetical protein [Gammaproteobacteria bacterium]